jgi:hypothetical protein
MQTALNTVGGITKALLNALDQIEQYAAASQIGPDGKPSGSSVYMHMPMGYAVDPKMFANPWTPGGGDSSTSFNNDGAFVQPAPQPASTGATASNGTGPAGAVFPPPATPDPKLQASIQNAMFTAALVDNMLQVTNKGVAAAWPDRRVSIEYFTILEGMQPAKVDPPAKEVLDAVKAAQKLLYLMDDKGNFVGYTQLYAQYRRNRKAWTDAIGAQAAAFAKAMSDPVAGQTWPIQQITYANTVKAALDDFNSMGRREVEDALTTISTVGQNAVKALVDLAHQLYDSNKVFLGPQDTVGTPWSYLSPISWWDHTDNSFGVQKITASTAAYEAGGGSGQSSFSNNWWKEQSSSTSASAGVSFGIAGGDANFSHSDASNAFADHNGRSSWSHFQDKSRNATVTCEFFLATIERPWYLGDLFNIEGWYLVGQKKNSISDGTITGQLDNKTKLLPMVPKAFLIVRNVAITADDWGDAGNAFEQAQANASGSGQSSSNSFGVSAHYLCYSGSVQHSDQQASGAFGSDSSAQAGWHFERNANGGTLTLTGSSIIGWVGEIQPAAPLMDAPASSPSTGTATPAKAAE